jgi:hypothetical protein
MVHSIRLDIIQGIITILLVHSIAGMWHLATIRLLPIRLDIMLGLTLTLQAPVRTLLVQQGQPHTQETRTHLGITLEHTLIPRQ